MATCLAMSLSKVLSPFTVSFQQHQSLYNVHTSVPGFLEFIVYSSIFSKWFYAIKSKNKLEEVKTYLLFLSSSLSIIDTVESTIIFTSLMKSQKRQLYFNNMIVYMGFVIAKKYCSFCVWFFLSRKLRKTFQTRIIAIHFC